MVSKGNYPNISVVSAYVLKSRYIFIYGGCLKGGPQNNLKKNDNICWMIYMILSGFLQWGYQKTDGAYIIWKIFL